MTTMTTIPIITLPIFYLCPTARRTILRTSETGKQYEVAYNRGGVGWAEVGNAGDALMSEEIREFVAGDKITITTTLEHEANIAGITVSYHSESEPHAS